MNSMITLPELSVVIRSVGEPGLWRTIESIDVPCEIIVALAEDAELFDEVSTVANVVLPVERMQQAKATNAGVACATGDIIIIMDADAVFSPGSLHQVQLMLQVDWVTRMHIAYSPGTNVMQKLLADVRHHINNSDMRYWFPGLAIRRDALTKIGGTLCNDALWWDEDSELDLRIRDQRIGQPVNVSGSVEHAALPLARELRAHIRYGRGAYTKRQLLGLTHPVYLRGYKEPLKRALAIRKQSGVGVLLAAVVLDCVMFLGELYEAMPIVARRQGSGSHSADNC